MSASRKGKSLRGCSFQLITNAHFRISWEAHRRPLPSMLTPSPHADGQEQFHFGGGLYKANNPEQARSPSGQLVLGPGKRRETREKACVQCVRAQWRTGAGTTAGAELRERGESAQLEGPGARPRGPGQAAQALGTSVKVCLSWRAGRPRRTRGVWAWTVETRDGCRRPGVGGGRTPATAGCAGQVQPYRKCPLWASVCTTERCLLCHLFTA